MESHQGSTDVDVSAFEDIWHVILRYTDIPTLISVSAVCSSLHRIVHEVGTTLGERIRQYWYQSIGMFAIFCFDDPETIYNVNAFR
eukprot:m.397475 g.397475  ORF g.397475 m.397475 type:complete len:86 (+) comp21130_c0_seq1:384-641(+)